MRLEEKRKVVEVLLNADATLGCSSTAARLGYAQKIGLLASELWRDRFADTNATYEGIALEAAYRLIETSATLRKEWFGR